MAGRKGKTVILSLLLMVLVGLTSAADIDFGGGESVESSEEITVWMNHDKDDRSATLSCGTNSTISSVTIGGSSGSSPQFETARDQNEWTLDFENDLKAKIEDNLDYPKDHKLEVNCEDEEPVSAIVNAEEVDTDETQFKVVDGDKRYGKAIVGESFTDDSYENSNKMELNLVIRSSDTSISNLVSGTAENFRLEGNEISITDSDINVDENGPTELNIELSPSVRSFTDDELDLDIRDDQGNLITTLTVKPKIYDYSFSISESPQSKIDFENVLREDYEYVADIKKESPGGGELLSPEDFGLTIERFKHGEFVPPDTGKSSLEDVDFEEAEWLDWSPTSGNNENEYRIYIENMNYITELPDGLYRFELVLKKEDSIIMDRIQVDKGTVFSGKVQDSEGGGVKTDFFFDGERSVAFESRGDGSYSQEIKAGTFDYSEIEFYDTGSSSYDSKIFINNPDLSKETDLGGTGESSVIFDYYSDPDPKLAGVDPVNMFSVKFGYDMESVGKISSKFDSSNINPDNLQVYECGDWNFAAEECNEDWSSSYIKGEDFTIDKGSLPYRVNIDKVSLFRNPDDGKDILNNAYMLGTAADIELGGQFEVSGPVGGEIPGGENLTVTGDIVDEQGNSLGEGHEVEIEFGDAVKLDARTDSDGNFEVEGQAPSEPGEYEITVTSDPEGYGSLEKTFEEPLTVYREKDVSLDIPSTYSVVRDQEEELEVVVENSGQVDLEGVSLSFSGMDSSLYSVSEVNLGNLEVGESTSSTLTVEVPGAFEDAYPSLDAVVSAQADGNEVKDSGEIQFEARNSGSSDNSNESENTSEGSQNVDGGSSDTENAGWSTPSAPSLNNVTGEFMQDRSTLNLALGIITVFLMILAAAVKKDKENGRGPAGGMRDRPMSGSGAATSVNVSASSSKTSEKERYVHEESGKKFDTKEGLEMYKEMQS